MSDNKDNAEIIKHKLHQVEETLSRPDFLNQYILTTLNGFAYRYFDNPMNAEMLTSEILRVTAIEQGIKEAIKIKNPELRAGISELVKRVSKAEGPTIMREIRVTKKPGQVLVSARISFGHPEHQFLAGTFIEKTSACHYEDELSLRNTLARHLEEVCEIFS